MFMSVSDSRRLVHIHAQTNIYVYWCFFFPSAPGLGLWENALSRDSGMEAREREAKCDFWGLTVSEGQGGLRGAV